MQVVRWSVWWEGAYVSMYIILQIANIRGVGIRSSYYSKLYVYQRMHCMCVLP